MKLQLKNQFELQIWEAASLAALRGGATPGGAVEAADNMVLRLRDRMSEMFAALPAKAAK